MRMGTVWGGDSERGCLEEVGLDLRVILKFCLTFRRLTSTIVDVPHR